MLKKLSILLLVLNASINVFGQNSIDEAIDKYNSGSIPYIYVSELKTELESNENLILLDTRTKEEYEVSHLKDAIWIGYKDFNKDFMKNIDENAEIIVYCSVGVRSEKIGEELKVLGYQNIRNLYGGIFLWMNEGYPIYNNGMRTQDIHTYNKRWENYITNGKKVN